jgi:hypothetical protein
VCVRVCVRVCGIASNTDSKQQHSSKRKRRRRSTIQPKFENEEKFVGPAVELLPKAVLALSSTAASDIADSSSAAGSPVLARRAFINDASPMRASSTSPINSSTDGINAPAMPSSSQLRVTTSAPLRTSSPFRHRLATQDSSRELASDLVCSMTLQVESLTQQLAATQSALAAALAGMQHKIDLVASKSERTDVRWFGLVWFGLVWFGLV